MQLEPKRFITSIREEIWFIPEKEGEVIGEEDLCFRQYHKEGEPAYSYQGYHEWVYYGKLHRYDGPAVYQRLIDEDTNEEILEDECWYIHDNPIVGDNYKQWLLDMGMDICNLSPEDKMLIDMKWKS